MQVRMWLVLFVLVICLTGCILRPWMVSGQPSDSAPELTPTPAADVPVELTWQSPISAGSTHDVPPAPAVRVGARPALTKPEGIDLDVTFISRDPMYQSYCVAYPEHWNGTVGLPRPCPGTENEKRWPDPGEVVTFTAHIVNKGTVASGPFAYRWYIDGSPVLSGTHPSLAPAAEGTATYLWAWAHTMDGDRVLDDHTVRLVVDPQEAIAECYESNNALEDRTNALSLRMTLTPEMLDVYNIPVTSTLPFSAEDWLQKQIAAMNQALANSVYPVTPHGATERVRLNQILIAAEAPDDGRAHDGEWIILADVRDPEVNFYTYEEDIDWGLVHELSHQVALIDLYAGMIDAYSVHVLDGEGFPANFAFQWPRAGLMGGGDIAPHTDSHLYSSHSAGGISSSKGYRNNYYGTYQYDIPEHNALLVLDNEGHPASGVQVELFQRSGPFNWIDLPEIDNGAEISGTTGADGRLTLANRNAHGGVVTPVGHTLRDNPFGLIDIVGLQNLFLVKLSQQDHVEFHWLDVTQFNLAYWMGDTISHTFTIASHVPPVGVPTAPPNLTVRTAGSHATLSWQPSASPGVVGYRVYRATPPEYPYVLASDMLTGTSFEEEMTDGSTWSGHCIYAVTAVDSSGRESGFGSLVYAPGLHTVRDVVVQSDGTRVVLDPWNHGALLRQQADGRYTQRMANPAHGLFDGLFLATDKANRLLVGSQVVRVFDRDANPLFQFGEAGSGLGQFDVPTGIAVWEGPPDEEDASDADEHTLLLLHFDGDTNGAQGEVGTAKGTSFVPGHDGLGVLIDDSDTLTYTAEGNLNLAAGTIAFWVQPQVVGDVGEIHDYFEFDDAGGGIQILRHGGGGLVFLMTHSTDLAGIEVQTRDWRAGEWHHVAATWQTIPGGRVHLGLFVDGQLRASQTFDASPPTALPRAMYVGTSPRGDWQANAVIDELRISDSPRYSGVGVRILVADSGNHRIQAFDALGNALSSFGSYGSGPGQFNSPQGLAIDAHGRVIVADSGNDRLQILDFDGTNLTFHSIIAAGLSRPHDVVVGGLGHIVVADTGNHTIQLLDALGAHLTTFTAPTDGSPGPFSEPHGVAIDSAGTIIVADSGNQRVVMIYGAVPMYESRLPLVFRN